MTHTPSPTDENDERRGPAPHSAEGNNPMTSASIPLTAPDETAISRTPRPISRDPNSKAWVLTRYADVAAALSDARFLDSQRTLLRNPTIGPRLRDELPDPKVSKAFFAEAFRRTAKAQRPALQAVVDAVLDRLQDTPRFDLLGDLARPIVTGASLVLLGLPQHGYAGFKLMLDTVMSEPEHSSKHAYCNAVLQSIVAATLDQPEAESFPAELRRCAAGVRGATTEFLVTQLFTALVGGWLASTSTLARALRILAAHPDDYHRLRDTPSLELQRRATEELLRLTTKADHTTRWVRADTNVNGVFIPGGSRAVLDIAAANRDPEQFADPEEFNLDRVHNAHLALGRGLSKCVAASWARLLLDVAIATTVRRLPHHAISAATLEGDTAGGPDQALPACPFAAEEWYVQHLT